MTEESLERETLKGTEALGLYRTELANKVLLMSQQSALLAQALFERADLLTRIAGKAGPPKET
jgi:hypothetical protein